MRLILLLFAVIFMSFNTADTLDAASDFEALKQLEGKWSGTLYRSNDSSDAFNLEYSITSNGSALLEESNTGGIEMLTIFNVNAGNLLLTHYCGLKNKPVSLLESSADGVYVFQTDATRSGLTAGKDMYVDSWKVDLIPEDDSKIYYEYTVVGPKGIAFVAKADLARVK
jgi:hypothetical protein